MIRALLAVMLTGCAMIDPSPAPEGWPQLRVVLMDGEINCKAAGVFVLACMRPDFDAKECYVWMPKEAPQWMREHEEEHCQGHDHFGDSTLRDSFRQWRERGGT